MAEMVTSKTTLIYIYIYCGKRVRTLVELFHSLLDKNTKEPAYHPTIR